MTCCTNYLLCACRVSAAKKGETAERPRGEEGGNTVVAATHNVDPSEQEHSRANSTELQPAVGDGGRPTQGNDTHPKPNSPMQHENVFVECGSTLCEFEIKAYEIPAEFYAGEDIQPQACTPPQGIDEGDASNPQDLVQNNLVLVTENGPLDSA